MNEITPLQTWLDTTTDALQALSLQVEYDKSGAGGHCHGRLVVTKEGGLLHHKYVITFLCESRDGSGSGNRRFYAQLLNPKVKRTVRLKVFTPENIASIANYAATALASWQETDRKAKERTNRKAVADSVARRQEIDSAHVPAWAVVSANIEDNQNADTFRLSFRAYDVGYPLKALTPDQIKRVLHFIKFIDKPAAPACTCDCLPCQSCDHR